jgi:hypothetical protein
MSLFSEEVFTGKLRELQNTQQSIQSKNIRESIRLMRSASLMTHFLSHYIAPSP